MRQRILPARFGVERMPWGLLRVAPAVVLLFVFFEFSDTKFLIENFWLPIVGIGGALIANATGIGGGAVFVPVFGQIGMADSQIVGSSLLIQSFGMTMGALTFLHLRQTRPAKSQSNYFEILALAAIATYVGMWLTLRFDFVPDIPVSDLFKVGSLALLPFLIGSAIKGPKQSRDINFGNLDRAALVFISLIGGCFIAWISIGAGELIAIFLMVRGMRAMDAVGIAVIVTSIVVLAYQLTLHDALPLSYDVGLSVAFGAIVGGFLAPYIVARIGDAPVKLICAAWITISFFVA